MNTLPFQKYRPYPRMEMPRRAWPDRVIERAPAWCSVDLRDGNQALIDPMNLDQKLRMFELLVKLGFKEIEIGFPSASATEYDFTRKLIDDGLIPEDVAVQVLCQAREHLIEKTFESLRGCERAIFHLYNSTSELQRRVVFNSDREGVKKIAVEGTKMVKKRLGMLEGCDLRFQYSPESFTGTEPDYALEICEAVMDVWEPERERPIILNLPATVEMSTPNVFADRIEWFCGNLKEREKVVLSVHNHNDRGCAVASTELALMAGADRVEGTLFGNGERTGNVDVVTLACNLYSQGVDPKLDFTDMAAVKQVAEDCTRLPVHERHPYAGLLVFTAFSGSHQDAINKGMKAFKSSGSKYWEVPYLPIDPDDLGCTYEEIVRINSQSGKGGVAYVLEEHYGFKPTRDLQIEFGREVQELTEKTGKEVTSRGIYELFCRTYQNLESPLSLLSYSVRTVGEDLARCDSRFKISGAEKEIGAEGNGPIDAFVKGVKELAGINFKITDYSEHSMGDGSGAGAACYVRITLEDGRAFYGLGNHPNTNKAAFLAVISCVNRSGLLTD